MKKDRLVQLRKKLEEKQRQLVEEVGRNSSCTARGPRTIPSRSWVTRRASAYNREFLFELGKTASAGG